MTIQEKIDALKKEFETKIAKLEKQAKIEEKQKQRKVFIPGVDEEYWYLTSRGYDGDKCDYDDGIINDFTEEVMIRGLCFKTKEEVELADQHRIVETELKHFVAENDPNPITEEDWEGSDDTPYKYYIRFFYQSRDEIKIDYTTFGKDANQVYASTREVLEKAIEHIGEERLKKYYFGVKE